MFLLIALVQLFPWLGLEFLIICIVSDERYSVLLKGKKVFVAGNLKKISMASVNSISTKLLLSLWRTYYDGAFALQSMCFSVGFFIIHIKTSLRVSIVTDPIVNFVLFWPKVYFQSEI